MSHKLSAIAESGAPASTDKIQKHLINFIVGNLGNSTFIFPDKVRNLGAASVQMVFRNFGRVTCWKTILQGQAAIRLYGIREQTILSIPNIEIVQITLSRGGINCLSNLIPGSSTMGSVQDIYIIDEPPIFNRRDNIRDVLRTLLPK